MKKIIDTTSKNSSINMRVNKKLVDDLKKIATQKSIPYQALCRMILTEYAEEYLKNQSHSNAQ